MRRKKIESAFNEAVEGSKEKERCPETFRRVY